MKKKKGRKGKVPAVDPLPLPLARRVPALPGAPQAQSLCWSGKWQGEGTVAFSVTLPALEHRESMAYLEEMRDAVLRYWKEQSSKPRQEVWFGGMDVLWKGDHYELAVCFAPFSRREYVPRARIDLTPEGEICRIRPPGNIRKRGLPRWRGPQSR